MPAMGTKVKSCTHNPRARHLDSMIAWERWQHTFLNACEVLPFIHSLAEADLTTLLPAPGLSHDPQMGPKGGAMSVTKKSQLSKTEGHQSTEEQKPLLRRQNLLLFVGLLGFLLQLPFSLRLFCRRRTV